MTAARPDGSQSSDAPIGPFGPLAFADLRVGSAFISPAHVLTLEEVVSFAREWDPQSYHTDPAAAETSIFRRLSASGIHSFALSHRLFDELRLFRRIGLAGTGMKDLRWRRPIYPGDTLRVSGTIADIRPEREGRAVIMLAIEVFNQEGDVALHYDLGVLVRTDG